MAGAAVVGGTEAREGRAERVGRAVARARSHLLGLQDASGFWHFPMEANATMDAQYVFANRLLGRRKPAEERRLGDHLLATQNDAGGWPLYHGGPAHPSCSIEAYFALKLLGHAASEPAMERARRFILDQGGAVRAQVFTRIFLAFFGQFPWDGVPALPPEILLLPDRSPLSIYRMSSWARSTVVPLLVLLQHRPAYGVPPGQGIEELWVEPPTAASVRFAPDPRPFTIRNLFLVADRVLRLFDRLPVRLRRRGLERALHWILERQDRNGGWGGIQPAMVNSVLALRAMGCALDHPAMVAGLQAIDDFLVEREGHLLFQPCVSPTWDTALTVRALVEAGDDPADEHVRRAMRWLERCQITERRGDWAVLRPDLPAGGWAFEFANDWYPDVDDSAVILMDMALAGATDSEVFRRGLAWTLGMQCSGGGYGAFDVENTLSLWNEIPFADMKAMIDPPTEDLTGRLCELMGLLGFDPGDPRAREARAFLRRTQRSDGAWWGRWGVNYIYGTWSALAGLRALGAREDEEAIRRGCAFLRAHQNDDGGFGESCRTYDEPREPERGPSTPSQTAWAVMGLLSGEGISPEVERAVDHLCHAQDADGSWPEPEFTGTGFPGHFYLRYDGYRNFFPLMALGRYRRLAERVP